MKPSNKDMKTRPAWIKGMEKKTGKDFSPQKLHQALSDILKNLK